MPRLTNRIGLRMPLNNEYFSIDTWNTNMRILDEAYALLKDESGTHNIPADMINFNNSGTGMRATTVQTALDELVKSTLPTEFVDVTVDDDITINVASYSHVWIVLRFLDTVYDVTFTSSSGGLIEWEGDEPEFEPNSVYELSFLKLNCKWFKR